MSKAFKIILPILFLLSGSIFATELSKSDRDAVLTSIDKNAEHFGEVSRKIWEFAEVGYKEVKSSDLLKSELRAAGFEVQEGVAEIPTAFVASWGSGKPVIGILAEFDALPGLSQEDVPEKKVRTSGAAGHGCGHNLFGTAAVQAGVAVKEMLAKKNWKGTIRVYGTPAEEGGSGKVYLVRAGLFQDTDVVIAWHPEDENHSSKRSSLANISAKFRFTGIASHASASPEKGRSALDAVQVMTHAVDLLREHVPTTTRLHYIITNGGGAPNIVPDFAEVFLYARHPEMESLDGIWERIKKCAEAGALATETQLSMEIIHSSYNMLPNDVLAQAVDRNFRIVGGVQYTPDEIAFAENLRKTMDLNGTMPLGSESKIQPIRSDTGTGSTDVGDVSWNVPVADFVAATWVPGTAAHSWQAVACSGSSIGRKGMVVAAKTIALTALDLFTDPKLVEQAKANFKQRKGNREYRSRIPADKKPPLNYRDK
ncbi:MAG TPA: amidohydrolase [Acidobacteriota bacterium]|nr:amidohydrolase [Acidobacteriota bacterium]